MDPEEINGRDDDPLWMYVLEALAWAVALATGVAAILAHFILGVI